MKKNSVEEADSMIDEQSLAPAENGHGTDAAPPRPGMLSYKPVGALLAGLSVLRFLSAARSPLPLAQISRELKINPSTCLNILRTLTQEGYLTLDVHSKMYSMGLGLLELFDGVLAQCGDLRPIRSLTDEIAIKQGATITLWRRVSRDRKILVLESLPVGEMAIRMGVGQRLPLLIGATGKLWAANSDLSRKELSTQFRQLRLERRPRFDDFMAEADESLARGWSLDRGDYTAGATSISVPVPGSKGDQVFAFTATVFSQQFSDDRIESIVADLQRPAAALAAAVPYL